MGQYGNIIIKCYIFDREVKEIELNDIKVYN